MKTEYLIIKEENSFCNSKDTFFNLLRTNGEISVSSKIIKHKKFEVKFSLSTLVVKGKKKDERHFIVILERDTLKGNSEAVIKNFTEVNRIFKKIIKESNFDFRFITLWDDISVYYSHKAYPVINEIENLMRKLIFKFMFTNVGVDWIEAATPKDYREAVLKKADKNKVKDIIENSLYESDFIHLAALLFKEYHTADMVALIEKIKKAKNVNEIEFKELKELIPRSNWDRYFAHHLKLDGLKEKWEKLYDLRNKIAHNKPINKEDYDQIVLITEQIKPNLESALSIKTLEIPEKEKKEVSEVAAADILPHIASSGTIDYPNLFSFSKKKNRYSHLYKYYSDLDTSGTKWITSSNIMKFKICSECGNVYSISGEDDNNICYSCLAKKL